VTSAFGPSVSPRWFARLLARRRYSVTEHGTENVPLSGAAVLAADRAQAEDRELLELFGSRRVHVSFEPLAVRTCLQLLAQQQALAVLLDRTAGILEQDRFHRRTAYLALVSGAPVVPVTVVRSDRLALVYGAPYRTEAQPWPRTKRLVAATSVDLRVHALVAHDAALRVTGGTS
jgi:1-acyl-sn-glycerol-3-phosphate acyltransferase